MSWRADLAAVANRILRRYDAELVRGAELRQREEAWKELWRPLSRLGNQPPRAQPSEALSAPFLKVFRGRKISSLQEPFDFAVVMPTTLRTTIADAVRSVSAQRFQGTVQMLVGLDSSVSDALRVVDDIGRSVPDCHSLVFFYPGYSTSQRHGGIHATRDGGAMRTILSYLANSPFVAYLDDDNWWSDDHLSSLHAVLSAGAQWAYALRWYVHPVSRKPICHDEWESLGPGRGFFAGVGWVDPNCLAMNKIECEAVLRWWSIPLRDSPKAMDADRNVFRFLSTEFNGVPTGKYSVFYQIDETDTMHSRRLNWIGTQRYSSCGG